MNRIRQLRIGYRMGLGFGMVLLLLVGTLIFAIVSLFNMSAMVDGFYYKPFRIVALSQTISGAIQGQGGALLQAMVRETAADARPSLEEANAMGIRIDEAMDELGLLSADEAGQLDTLSTLLSRLNRSRTVIIEDITEGDPGKARAEYLDTYQHLSEEARLLSLAICEEAEDAGHLYMVRSNDDALRQALIVLAVMLVAGVMMAFTIRWIVRSITGPVRELETLAEGVAHGDLTVTSDYHSHDELGDLADMMRKAVVSLSSYIEEIQRSLTALGHGDFDHRTRDIFDGDFVAIRQAIDGVAALLKEQHLKEQARQAELRRAYDAANYANRSKSDFLSSMSHDIRTPMNAIIGMTAIAMTSLSDTEKTAQCLKKISLSSKHLLGLINDVLDMSKIESGRMTLANDSMSLPEVMENIVNISQPQIKAKRQQFSIRLHDIEHERLYADSLRLNQVFINILSNAVKFTPVGGEISIDVQELPSRHAGYAHFSFVFTDAGRGMSPAFVKDIFSAFSREMDGTTDRTEGTGLGMAITKKIVDLMQGDITVDSEPGRGSRFTVDLHLRIADTPPEAMHLPDVRVLVVDDDRLTCETAAHALEEIGMLPAWVQTGDEAIEAVSKAARAQAPFHAIILDWQMPDMDGITAARAIRRAVGPDVPILIISAYDWSDISDEARAAGVDGFISKPLFKSTLYYGLRRFVLGEESAGDERDRAQDISFVGKNILLVEDNEINREIAVELLRAAGPGITCATNGAEAVTQFTESPEGYFDLVLMDIQMPVMDGYEATRLIRGLHRSDAASIPIIAMTANAFSEDVEAAKAAGMNHHLAKPLDPVRMMREIARFL